MIVDAITRAVLAISESEPEILSSLSIQEVRAEVEALTARLLATARERKANDLP